MWLIAYDITDPRRLVRIHRYAKTVAIPVQYSLYACYETARGILGIRDALADMINDREDDVRIYQLPQRLRVARFGSRSLPKGLLVAEGVMPLANTL
ncbi:CRISPR-associated endonuclease Cas2 [Tepidimonas charontis]|nr:CRISPR-associated endonuclease Cas2 [Tepidimonas charontis]